MEQQFQFASDLEQSIFLVGEYVAWGNVLSSSLHSRPHLEFQGKNII